MIILRQFNKIKLVQTCHNYVIMLPYSKLYYTNVTTALEQFEKLKYNY